MAKPEVLRFWDSLSNLVAGLGGEKDKAAASTWRLVLLSPEQLEAAYRGDWMARKVVEIPADDSTREWRFWQADDKDTALIEAEEERLGLQHKTCEAQIKARLFGGSVMIMGVGDQDASTPLGTVKKGDLQFIHVLTRHEVGTGSLNRDPLDRFFGEPEYYTINSQSKGSVKVHPSRVVRFVGNGTPSNATNTDGWGDSVLQALGDSVKDAGGTLANIANLVYEAKIDIINVPDLADTLSNEEYTRKLIERFSNANALKSVLNTLLLAEDEKWQRVQATFTGLPDIAQLFLLCTSGAADIPATRFLGQSPAGLSATGESDIRNYYDKVASMQNTRLRPALRRLDDVVIMSALGKLNPDIYYDWAPLWQLDEVQRAETNLKLATAFKIDVDANLLDINTLRQAREQQIIESETYPGFKQLLADQPEEPVLQEADPVVQGQFEEIKKLHSKRRRIFKRDMQPKSLYVRRNVTNAKEIIAWAKAQGFSTTLNADDMHVTVCYSKEPVDWLSVGEDWTGNEKGEVVVGPGGPRVVEKWATRNGKGDVVVLQFSSSALQYRHMDLKARGASWDFPEYIPHISITYDPGDVDVDDVEPYRGKIVLGPEIFEEIDDDWADKIKEDRITVDRKAKLGKRVAALEAVVKDGAPTTPPAPQPVPTIKVDVQPVIELKRPRKTKITQQKDGSAIVENLDEETK